MIFLANLEQFARKTVEIQNRGGAIYQQTDCCGNSKEAEGRYSEGMESRQRCREEIRLLDLRQSGETKNRNKAMFLNLGLVEMSNCFCFLSHCCGRYTKSSL